MRTFGFILLVVFGAAAVSADKKEDHPGWDFCLGQNVETTAVKEANETCQTELKITSTKKIWDNKCFGICRLRKLGFVGADDAAALDNAKIAKYVDATYPEAARAGIKADLIACGTAKLKASEEKCKHFKPLIECFNKALKKNCKAKNVGQPAASGSSSASSSGSGQGIRSSSPPTVLGNGTSGIRPSGGDPVSYSPNSVAPTPTA